MPATQDRSRVPPLAVDGLVHRFRPDLPPAVDVPRLDLPGGARLAVTGPSGSGKTTLAYLLTGIERVGEGRVRWGDAHLESLGEGGRDRWRRENVGLVFQDFHLVPGLSIRDNVLTSVWFDHLRAPPALIERARHLLETCKVPQEHRAVGDLSRGEQQRVALARALLRRPPILVADEPTASLDAANARLVVDLLLAQPTTLIAVSHDPALVEAMGRTLRLERGREASTGPPARLPQPR